MDTQSERVQQRSGLLLLLLLSIAFIRGCIYLALVPPWQAPDENGHFEHAWLIAYLRRLSVAGQTPVSFERELIASLYEWRYGEYIGRPLPDRMPVYLSELPQNIFAVGSRSAVERFSISYVWTAAFIWPVLHQDLLVQLYAARLSSVILNVGIIWLSWLIFKTVLPGHLSAVAAMTAFVVFLPQHTYINASVSDGPLAEWAACLVLYGWLRSLLHLRWRYLILVVLGTLIGLWSKRTTAFLIPLNFVMFGVALFQALTVKVSGNKKFLLFVIVLIASIFLMGIVWKLPAGHFIYEEVRRWMNSPDFFWKNGPVDPGLALRYTFESFWGQFGWMNVRAGEGWYLIIYVLVALAVEGWLLPRAYPWSVSRTPVFLMGLCLTLSVGGWLIFTAVNPAGLRYYQGRYLFPATVPIAFFLVGGWMRNLPTSQQHLFLPLMLLLMAVLDGSALCLHIWPYFYNP